MVYSLDPISPDSLKAEARALRTENAGKGTEMSLSAALEATAKAHGYRDWNTAAAMLREPVGCPAQLGQRVSGSYLKQRFDGTVLATASLPGGRFFRLTIQFDKPVDVVTFDSFSAFRQRVTIEVDAYGRSPARTSDGELHMQLDVVHARRRK